MAYTTINKSTDYFNTKLYTGTSSTNAVTGVGFQPDMVWIKNRTDVANHNLYDAVRGTSAGKLKPNDTPAESYNAQDLSVFGTDGFTVGGNNEVNGSGDNMVAWNWRAGNSSGSANTDGTINSTVSANTTAGFSIVSYTANATAGATVGHGLGAVPKMIIVKSRTSVDSWIVYHAGNTSAPETDYLSLNTTDATADDAIWNDTAPTSSVFSLGTNAPVNGSGKNLIAYCFAEKTGYSKFGSYVGNGNADGTFVYTGFRPAWVLIKQTNTTNNWILMDNKRPGYNLTNSFLEPDGNGAEIVNNANNRIDMLSNGFKIRGTGTGTNASSGNYIYMAFGQSLVGSNNVPCTAR